MQAEKTLYTVFLCIKYMETISKEVSTIIVHFMTLGVEMPLLRCGHIGHNVSNIIFFYIPSNKADTLNKNSHDMAKINKEDCTKIACVCYDSRAGFLCKGMTLLI